MSKWQIPPPAPHDTYLRRLSELEPEADKRIRNQHVVSKVILKGFAAPGPHGSGLQLTPFDLRLGHEQKPRGLAGCGKVPDFLKFASASAEQLWKTVEDQLHDAIAATRSGHLHNDEAHAKAIKDCIALHLVRSIRYLKIHGSVIAKSTEDVRRRAMQSYQPILQTEFRRRYGFEAAGPEALAVVLNEPISEWQALDARGALVRASIEAMFDRMRETLRALQLEVLHVPRGYELLISDSPAVTLRYLQGGASVEPNVAVGDSNCIILPLARDCLVATGPEAKEAELLPEKIDFLNKLQIKVSHRYVYYHPESGLGKLVQATR